MILQYNTNTQFLALYTSKGKNFSALHHFTCYRKPALFRWRVWYSKILTWQSSLLKADQRADFSLQVFCCFSFLSNNSLHTRSSKKWSAVALASAWSSAPYWSSGWSALVNRSGVTLRRSRDTGWHSLQTTSTWNGTDAKMPKVARIFTKFSILSKWPKSAWPRCQRKWCMQTQSW